MVRSRQARCPVFLPRRLARLSLAALGLLLPPAVLAAPASDPGVSVMIDHAKVIRLPERTQTVIVGNPVIADVTTQKNGILVVTGKSYGITNLIALDAAGALLAESMIRVRAPSEAT
jgi:Flp pilus assembly secretin CpaC